MWEFRKIPLLLRIFVLGCGKVLSESDTVSTVRKSAKRFRLSNNESTKTVSTADDTLI